MLDTKYSVQHMGLIINLIEGMGTMATVFYKHLWISYMWWRDSNLLDFLISITHEVKCITVLFYFIFFARFSEASSRQYSRQFGKTVFRITTVLPTEKGPYLLTQERNGSSLKCGKVEDCILQRSHKMESYKMEITWPLSQNNARNKLINHQWKSLYRTL